MKPWTEVRIYLGKNYNVDFTELDREKELWKIENCNNGLMCVICCGPDELIHIDILESICEQLQLFIPADVLINHIED